MSRSSTWTIIVSEIQHDWLLLHRDDERFHQTMRFLQ
jgi:hypothetical protein